MRLSRLYIGLGLAFLITGMGLGVWMAASQNFQYAPAHAHWNLLGFVTSTLYGLVHKTHPALARSRLAWPQFGLHIVGALLAGPGIILAINTKQDLPAMIGAGLVLLAAIVFLWMFLSQKAE